MKIGYFTERPYRGLPEEEILQNRAFFAVSNKPLRPEKAADDYQLLSGRVLLRRGTGI